MDYLQNAKYVQVRGGSTNNNDWATGALIAITERLQEEQSQFGQEICIKCDVAFTPTEDGQCLCDACLGEEWDDITLSSPGYDYDAMAEWQQEKQYGPVHDDTNA